MFQVRLPGPWIETRGSLRLVEEEEEEEEEEEDSREHDRSRNSRRVVEAKRRKGGEESRGIKFGWGELTALCHSVAVKPVLYARDDSERIGERDTRALSSTDRYTGITLAPPSFRHFIPFLFARCAAPLYFFFRLRLLPMPFIRSYDRRGGERVPCTRFVLCFSKNCRN